MRCHDFHSRHNRNAQPPGITRASSSYVPIPANTPAIPYPESYRDLALIVDAEVTSARIQHIIERHRMVARSIPFDIYEGEGVPEGKRSLAYRIVFQSPRGTLTSEQVDGYQSNILQQLQRELGVELRD